jgi:hypothetical protein
MSTDISAGGSDAEDGVTGLAEHPLRLAVQRAFKG